MGHGGFPPGAGEEAGGVIITGGGNNNNRGGVAPLEVGLGREKPVGTGTKWRESSEILSQTRTPEALWCLRTVRVRVRVSRISS